MTAAFARCARTLLPACALAALLSSCGESPPERRPAIQARTDTAPVGIPGRAPPAPIDADPRRLRHLDRAALRSLLGRPDFERRDGSALLLRYRHENCLLDLFLYDGTGIAHVEARGRDAVSPYATRACLEALLRAADRNDQRVLAR